MTSSDRVGRLVSLLEEAELDALLVSDLINLRYLTGFTGDNGAAVAGPQTRAFITDFRYVQQAAQEVDPSFARRRAHHELIEGLEDILPPGPQRLGVEEEHLSLRDYRRLREKLPARIELVEVEGLVERLRSVKEPGEVARIAEAAKLSDAAFQEVLARGLLGRTERELAFALAQKMHELGASRPSFDPVIAAGGHGALPHATPREVKIETGQLVVIDWGAELAGYCSDCTRTVAAGEPDADARAVYQLVLEAQAAGLSAVHAGAAARDVDSAARSLIAAAGHGEHFGHSLGHGVGMAIHEAPRVSQHSDEVFQAGFVVTIEPAVYLPERLGVRIEDLVAVTEQSCDVLTSLPKELMVVG